MNRRSIAVPRSSAFLALGCIGAFATAPAFATDKPVPTVADEEPVQDDILVNGKRIREDPKAVAPLVDTPRSIVVLDKAVIQQTGSVSLQDALRTVPGITFGAAEGGNPIGDRPFIRGFDSQGSLYLDGVRDFSAQTREVFAVDQIQIVRGSDSTLGGRGSAGGTINIVSKLPEARDFGSVSASFGNADFKRVTADLNLKIGDMAAFRIEGLYHDQNVADRDSIYQKRWGVAPSLTIGIGTPTRLTVAAYYLESHELPDSGIPYLYTIGNAPGTGNIASLPAIGHVTLANGASGNVARDTFYGLTDRDFRITRTGNYSLRVEHDFGGVTLRNTARYSHDYQGYIYTQPDDSNGNVYGTTATNSGANLTSGGYLWRRANTRYGYSDALVDQTDLYGKFATGGIQHSFSVGTEFSWEKDRRGTYVTRGFLSPTTGFETLSSGGTITPRCNTTTLARSYCTSIFTPNPNDPFVNYASDTSTVTAPIVRSLTSEETQNDGSTQAIYGFDSITILPSLILNLGARYDRFTSTVKPGLPYGQTAQFALSRTDDLFDWQAGLVLKPTKETSVYASYATSSTPPNSLLGEGQETNALGTTNTAAAVALLDQLKVTRTKSYEVGAKASLFHEKLALQADVFQTDTNNARVTTDQNTVAFLGRTRVRGAEITASGTILPGWTIFGGYTYLDPIITDGGFTALTAAAVGTRAAQIVTVTSVNTGKQIPQVARNSFTATTNVEFAHRFSIGGGAYYQDKVFGGYADNRTAAQTAAGVVTVTPATKILYRQIPDYWRFDAHAGVKLNRNLSLTINAQNLTNKVYFTQAYTTHYASIAAGRTVFGTVVLGF